MTDVVRKVDFFSLQIPNKPGQAFKVLSTLVSAGIDLLACSGSPRGRRAQIDIVPGDTRKFKAAVKKAGLAFESDRTGFLIQGKDRPGALAEHLKKLADGDVNIIAIDGLTTGEGRFGAIIWIESKDVRKAGKLLGA